MTMIATKRLRFKSRHIIEIFGVKLFPCSMRTSKTIPVTSNNSRAAFLKSHKTSRVYKYLKIFIFAWLQYTIVFNLQYEAIIMARIWRLVSFQIFTNTILTTESEMTVNCIDIPRLIPSRRVMTIWKICHLNAFFLRILRRVSLVKSSSLYSDDVSFGFI